MVPYESLVQCAEQTLQRLYGELDEAPFLHDLHHVKYEEPDYDEQLGMPGLHTVRPQVRFEERTPCIPPDLFAKYTKTNFWAQPELNTRGITVL